MTQMREFFEKWITDVSPMAMQILTDNVEHAAICEVKYNGDNSYEIQHPPYKHVVNLKKKVCNCRPWQLNGIRCAHTINAMHYKDLDVESFVDHWYKKETYLKAYSRFIQPMTNMKIWPKSTKLSIKPPEITLMLGRPRKERSKDNDEPSKKKFGKATRQGRKMKCSLCMNFGHNKKGCPIAKNGYTTGTARTATGKSGGATTSATSTGVTSGATGENGGTTISAASTGVTAGGSGGATTKRPATTSTASGGATIGGNGGATTSAASTGVTAGGSGGATTKRPATTSAPSRGATTVATTTGGRISVNFASVAQPTSQFSTQQSTTSASGSKKSSKVKRGGANPGYKRPRTEKPRTTGFGVLFGANGSVIERSGTTDRVLHCAPLKSSMPTNIDLGYKPNGLRWKAKTGSLCCVAARPHGSNAASGEWSMGPHEPYWRTNSSFSPAPSRWDFRFQPETLSFGSNDGVQLYGSSASSNSRDSRSWVRGNQLANHQYLITDGVGAYCSSPSDISPAQQWTPPAIQEINIDDFGTSRRDAITRPFSFSPTMEGASIARDGRGSTSSRSDSSDCDSITKSHSSYRSFPSRRFFMSKPIHPLSFPTETTPRREAIDSLSAGFLEFDASTSQRDKHRLSSASGSLDLTEASESFQSDFLSKPCNPSDGFRCGLCERFLSQRSPWSSRRIVRSGDMPVAGVLSCRHVFHAECLEQATPKSCKSDPPCPICAKLEEDSSPEQRVFSKFFPRLKTFSEEGPSKPWGCAHSGDCVEGALHGPSRGTMLSLNKNQIRKNLSLKGNSGKEFPGKLRKTNTFSSQLFIGSVDHAMVGSSKASAGSGLK
ncbi:uncharacterized protein LOC125868851 [Solanum stenotomum]|nr:uncharacterized protein LOC125868851 [Solanum stenotomum]